MTPDELEKMIDCELKRLPAPRAPRTLLPRVLAAVQARATAPWYQRAWLTWPRQWQALSLAALVALLAGAALLLPGVDSAAGGYAAKLAGGLGGRLGAAGKNFATGMNTALMLWRSLVQPALGYALALVTLMFLACVTFGTALTRVALKQVRIA